MTSLNSLFAPKSVAVVGVSRRDGTLGKMFMDTLVGMNYKGRIYPINPKAVEINGIPCFPEVDNIPEIPELAIILLPKEMVYTAVEKIAKKKIKNVIVISAGFKEIGKEGKKREESLVELIRKNNMRMVGPNSMGLFNTNPEISLNATFSPTFPIPGHIGFISQSGALGVAVLELSQKIGLGFSSFISTGNKADIGDIDSLRFMSGDDNTDVIILYQESIDHPDNFRKLCRKIIPQKPILSLKAGRTKSGLKAAQSHTGALASDDAITDAFMKQCGILRCETLQELLDSALAFTSQPLPEGKNVGVVTNAGGPGILVSDALEKHGLILATLSEDTKLELGKVLPPEASLNNPVDMIASATHKTYREVCQILEKEPNVDSIIVIIVQPPVDTTPQKIISELNSIVTQSKKPFFLTLMAKEINESGIEWFKATNVPIFSYPETTARALGNMVRYVDIRDQFSQLTQKAINTVSTSLPEAGNKRQASINEIIPILEKYNFKISDFVLIEKVEQAINFQKKAKKIALKIANEEIIHKSDDGLVILNLSSSKEIEDAYKKIKSNASKILPLSVTPRLLAQKMVSEGIELVLGAKRDPLYGPVVMFGIGGIFIELYRDVVFRVVPLDEWIVAQMIEELKGKNILNGFRNLPPIKREVLIKTILNFSRLICEHPEIVEIDLNPIIWSPDFNQPIIVDSRCTIIA